MISEKGDTNCYRNLIGPSAVIRTWSQPAAAVHLAPWENMTRLS